MDQHSKNIRAVSVCEATEDVHDEEPNVNFDIPAIVFSGADYVNCAFCSGHRRFQKSH